MNKKSKQETFISRKIEVVGLITSIAFQNAKLCAQTLSRCHSKIFPKPKIRGMLEFDWDEHLTKQRRKFGGAYWILLRPVAVYIDGQLVGSDMEFVEMVNYRYSCRMKANNNRYKDAISCDYSRYLVQSKRCYVYLEIWIDKTRVGNLVFQLYSDLLPETCCNFRCLCTGEKGSTEEGVPLSYKNTEIFRICPMGWIQGGDIENIKGGGGRSVYGATFADESYCISHERRGVLSMANDGKHSNGSQFFVTLQPTLWMDYYYVAFGQLVEGVEVLKAIEKVSTFYEKPQQRIKIAQCGVLYAPETLAEKEEKKRLEAEKESLRSYEAEARRIAMLNECTVISSVSDDENADQIIKFVPPADVQDPRDVPSELNVQRFLDGEYYVMDIPIKPEDIIRPILNDLADGVINEEDLIVYTSNEQLARSIILDCIAKGIVSYEDYDVDQVTSSDISMIHQYLWAIISNMSTTSTRQRKEESVTATEKSSEAIKDYLEEIVTSLTESSQDIGPKEVDASLKVEDYDVSYDYATENTVLRDEDGEIIETDVGLLRESENEIENVSMIGPPINMEGEGLNTSEDPDVDGIKEMYGAAMDDEAAEVGAVVKLIGSRLKQSNVAIDKSEVAVEVMTEILEVVSEVDTEIEAKAAEPAQLDEEATSEATPEAVVEETTENVEDKAE